jgi:hypothetical protein
LRSDFTSGDIHMIGAFAEFERYRPRPHRVKPVIRICR